MLSNTSKLIIALAIISINTSHAMRTPAFSLKNNSADTIQFDLKQNGKSLFDNPLVINAHKELFVHIDTANQNTVLHLFFCPPNTDCNNEQKKLATTFPKGQTIYIKFDGKKIEAQKGGSSGKTTLGFSTEHNVTNGDFVVVTGNIRSELVRSSSSRPISTQSAPVQPTKPTPELSSAQKPKKPAKPSNDTKPYHDLAWTKFPKANAIKEDNKALMQQYYNEDNDPRVRQMAQAVLGVTQNANHEAIDTAHNNLQARYAAMPGIVSNQKLYPEIVKIIDTAYAILSK
jgi:hypothetical protein